MIALERTDYDVPIGRARHGRVSIGPKPAGKAADKPSIASESWERGLKESAVYRFLQECPEHKDKPPAMICDEFERHMQTRPETLKQTASRLGIRYPDLCSFKCRHGLQHLSNEALCGQYRRANP